MPIYPMVMIVGTIMTVVYATCPMFMQPSRPFLSIVWQCTWQSLVTMLAITFVYAIVAFSFALAVKIEKGDN